MDRHSNGKVYAIPRGFVSADPGRNRYIRKSGTSWQLPSRLNPEYSHDVADPKNAVDWVGVGTDLGGTGLQAAAALAAPVTIPAGMIGAAVIGLQAHDKIRKSKQEKRKRLEKE